MIFPAGKCIFLQENTGNQVTCLFFWRDTVSLCCSGGFRIMTGIEIGLASQRNPRGRIPQNCYGDCWGDCRGKSECWGECCGVCPGTAGGSAGRLLLPAPHRESSLPALPPAVPGQIPRHYPAALPPTLRFSPAVPPAVSAAVLGNSASGVPLAGQPNLKTGSLFLDKLGQVRMPGPESQKRMI